MTYWNRCELPCAALQERLDATTALVALAPQLTSEDANWLLPLAQQARWPASSAAWYALAVIARPGSSPDWCSATPPVDDTMARANWGAACSHAAGFAPEGESGQPGPAPVLALTLASGRVAPLVTDGRPQRAIRRFTLRSQQQPTVIWSPWQVSRPSKPATGLP